ncbi:hypothetical protein L1D44_14090 [Shewanella sp. Isolate13]|uniref:PssE/Cps14G family polysaccharide biosynthesis glycosyltransferase n=1 Tax=Shewanella sp. Isolate13 TaxID=2908531 RepID=UPI001EFEAC60|nr:PssE/Cps14G family polysaccharide biosynthesis glycosyltransferase [Shewanella sp. Isolate13]MCG9730949.1 hypothetical protein [Shewanella sp. Isolate13]
MKILVTVGTGSFDSLVERCDKISSNSVDEFTFQIGKGGYQPKNGLYFDFSPDLNLTDFDLVISHCGAGTVFKCLNSKIPLIAIPNLERSDKHQSELGCYLEKHNFCCTCFDLTHLNRLIVDYDFKNYNDYNNISFFGVSEVIDIISDSFKE